MVNISKIEGIDLFIKRTPAIHQRWENYKSDGLYDPDERLPYIEMGEFADFFSTQMENAELMAAALKDLDDIFLKPRDDDLRNLMFSFIEDLTNCLMQRGQREEELVRFLPERFKEVYDDVINFWEEYEKIQLSRLEKQ